MSYQVLARKWRPRKFAELVGQEHVVRALTNALESGRMHHAYLFTGTRGVGKTTIARIFAKSLNCERGESSDPCGECAVCTAVDAGRFVDLLEIDAASNTGVDDVREVIENAQYAPSRGRFKVYLIDEVHMLSKPAFNALLKTLEEPPPHVKFLLATTDPQKLPVTVLSRCLKFNLKRMLPDQISGQMLHILGAEGIAFENEAVDEIARAADGSMRDGLSLLDQAIAYGAGALKAADVRAMLGSVDRGQVVGLLEALAANDGHALMAECDRIASFSPDFAGVLDDIAGLLHRLQLTQLVAGHGLEEAAEAALAERLSAEDVQLYYQIATTGRRDLTLAPDARTGFEMTLLRMLAFAPAEGEAAPAPRRAPAMPASDTTGGRSGASRGNQAAAPASAADTRAPQASAPASRGQSNYSDPQPPPRVSAPVSSVAADGEIPDWHTLIERANLRGPLGQLAQNASMRGVDGEIMTLVLKPAYMHLAVEPLTGQMEERLTKAVGRRIRLRFVADHAAGETPAERAAQMRDARQADAVDAIGNDPVVQALQRDFGARVIPQSIKPLEQ
ncbi:MAG TPA: DNA polymerase III subunit gamma/tau [Pinirhizobacter sp.]|uniref:DNA polymerase III subunit gamma/tau n=1 Tax=Pinirhizobacter sp. TaxID=2950432 RepID=UPI002CAAD30A|nr:DNA polymerase III subunit gamma/tau [Pinirhizobacter sp.]HMH69687.1 DNA polymerase III subunit gamma/tau [Pinirhizobacter sp.]